MDGKDAAPNPISSPSGTGPVAASAICDDSAASFFRRRGGGEGFGGSGSLCGSGGLWGFGVWLQGSLLAALTLLTAPAPAAPLPNGRVDGDRRNDAALRDIFFADPDRGWAVGDLGVILVTSDGGNVWVPQSSGTTGNLRSVYFSSPERGYAVGGWYESDTGLGRAIVLRTRDGGQSWTPLESDLPPLRSIRQLGSGRLIASGEWSPIHLGGVFLSEDDGVSWRAVGGEQLRQVAAASLSSDGVLMADDQGVLFAAAPEAIAGPSASPPEAVAVLPGVTALATAGPHAAAALGDRTFAISRDGGRRWTRIESPAPTPFLPLCAAAAVDGSLWFAGAPGRQVCRVDSQGVRTQPETGFDGPLYALHFHDQHRGWAVGGFGTILATRDGGRTWRVQRGGSARAMLLGVAVDPAELPWPVLASEALERGHRFIVAVAGRPSGLEGEGPKGEGPKGEGPKGEGPKGEAATGFSSGFNPLRASLGGRTGQAAAELGGGEVLAWDPAGRGSESIAAVIASCAPSVILLGADLSEEQRDRWLSQAMRAGVARVFEVSGESRAELTIHASAVLPVAGVLTADLWSDALALLDPGRVVPERLLLRRRWDESRAERLIGGVSDGLPSGNGRRPVPEGRRRNFQILQARSGETQLIERLVADAQTLDRPALERQLSLLVTQTPLENRERLLRKLLHRIESASEHRPSEVRLYRTALAEAARQPSASGFARAADLRLQSLLQSQEWQPLLADSAVVRQPRAEGTTERVAAHSSPFEKHDSPVMPVAGIGPTEGVPAAAVRPAGLPAAGPPRSEPQPAEVVELAGAEDLPWQMHPAVLVWKSARGPSAMSSWDRGAVARLGEALTAGEWKELLNPRPDDWLTAVPAIRAGRIERPLLDGRVDDPCWGDFASQSIEAAVGEAQVRFAYDADFLYFALRGSFGADDHARPAERRQRDAALAGQTRAVLEIDVDCDLLTAYELTVDARGHTRDTCDGFTGWQPIWYVATELEGGVRTIEAAVRRQDLVGLPPVAGDRWRIRARIIPAGHEGSQQPLADPCGWRTLVFK
ncbi:YCF48-related protein [Candidatus Laterigemmans baculatus]|uniref:YCF48-related protein n=1 Tax=Candidatus Laterigemmans baculatus TaxID=2770505 RepID=UPI0013DC0C52|nr:YCF48-related protein [Candidatus Laterigemmans baculatus]